MISLKIIGCLLDYPNEELWGHRDELIAEIEQAHEPAPDSGRRTDVLRR